MKDRATTWALLAISLAVLAGTQVQIKQLKRIAVEATDQAQGLERQVTLLQTELAAEREETRQVESRVDTLATSVGSRHTELEERTRATITESQARFQASLQAEVGQLRTSITSQSARLDALRPDRDALQRDLLQPTVQITCKGDIGSGVLVYSRRDSGGQAHSFVLTAHHVVSDVVQSLGAEEAREPVDLRILDPVARAYRSYQADIVSYDEGMDLALLKVRSDQEFANVARWASREKLQDLRSFTPIYTIGCPLGHEPMPSRGELTNLSKTVNGKTFWLVSAPTIFGNSGGGVFLEESHELIGVCSMVCVYQNLIPVPVSHMGVVVPGEAVLAWLDSQYLGFIHQDGAPKDACDWMRAAMRRWEPSVLALTWGE